MAFVENLYPDFAAFWHEAHARHPLEQQRLWRVRYEQPHQDLFDLYYSRYGTRDGLATALTRYGKITSAMQRIASDIGALAPPLASRVSDLFDADIGELSCVLMVGLFYSDAWVTAFRGRPTAFFALEEHANIKPQSLKITVAHELAHVLHDTCAPRSFNTTTIGEGLFAEGLAVLVSERIVPGTLDHVYLCPGGEVTATGQSCRQWVNECNERWPELRQRLLRDLDRDDWARFATYFWNGRHRTEPLAAEVPARVGYVVGYRVVENLARKYSIAELGRWSPERAIEAVRSTIEHIPDA